MGITASLTPAFSFIYRVDLGNGLVEHELDHVFTGTFQGTPAPDPAEVESWEWVTLAKVIADCEAEPERYSAWLPIALRELQKRA